MRASFFDSAGFIRGMTILFCVVSVGLGVKGVSGAQELGAQKSAFTPDQQEVIKVNQAWLDVFDHRDLIKLASDSGRNRLAKVWDEHTGSGGHESRREQFPSWVPSEVMKEAEALSVAEAENILSPWLTLGRSAEKGVRGSAARSSDRAAANF